MTRHRRTEQPRRRRVHQPRTHRHHRHLKLLHERRRHRPRHVHRQHTRIRARTTLTRPTREHPTRIRNRRQRHRRGHPVHIRTRSPTINRWTDIIRHRPRTDLHHRQRAHNLSERRCHRHGRINRHHTRPDARATTTRPTREHPADIRLSRQRHRRTSVIPERTLMTRHRRTEQPRRRRVHQPRTHRHHRHLKLLRRVVGVSTCQGAELERCASDVGVRHLHVARFARYSCWHRRRQCEFVDVLARNGKRSARTDECHMRLNVRPGVEEVVASDRDGVATRRRSMVRKDAGNRRRR